MISFGVMKYVMAGIIGVAGLLAQIAIFSPVHIGGWVIASAATWLYFDEAQKHQELLSQCLNILEPKRYEYLSFKEGAEEDSSEPQSTRHGELDG